MIMTLPDILTDSDVAKICRVRREESQVARQADGIDQRVVESKPTEGLRAGIVQGKLGVYDPTASLTVKVKPGKSTGRHMRCWN